MNNAVPALHLQGVCRSFQQGGARLDVLVDAGLTIATGEIVALVGPSGAGKSTLLQIAGLLERPDAGDVIVAGQACAGLNDDRRTALRKEHLGFVYQYHHLLPEFSAAENIILPQMINGRSRKQARERAMHLLGSMGLAKRADHRPGQLSGGEQQRVAICRALANAPKLLLADEPTGNLDPQTADGVFAELMRLVREEGLSALIATHNPELAGRMDRRVTLRNSKVVTL
ncbi:ABC transporter ATP-binding protein [Novispirillum itersonii]|uniref:ABC transporter ATP-binding protein n=1 Tax=Novispirillum itersonii TaxID=189 RepID=UPI000375E0BF|nr:ABC transporter ATP-binding protein [Novispirillum itersonii]